MEDASLLTPAAVVAMLVIRTGLVELRHPGRARRQWSFLADRRAMAAAAIVALLLSVGGWRVGGFAAVAWSVLAGALVAYVFGLSDKPDAEGAADRNSGRR